MSRYGLLAACALLVLVNAVVLAGVAYNRSGIPSATVELTERELPLGWTHTENTGLSLQLNWRRYDDGGPEWFNAQKLADAGFDCRTPVDATDAALLYGKALPRKTYVVLEFEGSAWDVWQQREKNKLQDMEEEIVTGKVARKALEEAKRRFAWEMVTASRLFVVDVGNDAALLRKRYPDRHRFIITPGVVRLHFQASNYENGKPKDGRLSGWIDEVLTDTLQVPLGKQGRLRTLQASRRQWRSYFYEGQENDKPEPPRYTVTVSYGRRYEPWVVAVRPFGAQVK